MYLAYVVFCTNPRDLEVWQNKQEFHVFTQTLNLIMFCIRVICEVTQRETNRGFDFSFK